MDAPENQNDSPAELDLTVVSPALEPAKNAGEEAGEDPDHLIGQVFAQKYRILSCLGRGGMGAVYKAQDVMIDRIVAIKILLPSPKWDPLLGARFRQEARAASHLHDPHIVQIYEFNTLADGQPYLVMGYVDGLPLSELIYEEGPLALERSINIFLQALDGLAHAHEQGVIHRDLKPSNLMITKTLQGADFVSIVDFGIAKLIDESTQPNLTQTGEVFGSPSYMSPEQCKGLKLDARSDIYAIGCLMYEVLSGKVPFSSTNFLQCVYMHINEPPAPFGQSCPELKIPPDIEAIIFKTLEKSPDDRYQSIRELHAALKSRQVPEPSVKPIQPADTAASVTPAVKAKRATFVDEAPPMSTGTMIKDIVAKTRKRDRLKLSLLVLIFVIPAIALFTDAGSAALAKTLILLRGCGLQNFLPGIAGWYRKEHRCEAAGMLYAYLGDRAISQGAIDKAEGFFRLSVEEMRDFADAYESGAGELNRLLGEMAWAVVYSPGEDEPQVKALMILAHNWREHKEYGLAKLAGKYALTIAEQSPHIEAATLRQSLTDVTDCIREIGNPREMANWRKSRLYRRAESAASDNQNESSRRSRR